MNYTDWKLRYDDDILGQILRFEKSKTRNKIISKSIGGGIYIQTVGTPYDIVEMDVFCTFDQRDMLNEHEAIGSLLTASYAGHVYTGFIEDEPTWNTDRAGEYYTATIKFIIEERVE